MTFSDKKGHSVFLMNNKTEQLNNKTEQSLSIGLFLLTYITLIAIADAMNMSMASDLALFGGPLFVIWLDRHSGADKNRQRRLLTMRSSWAKGIAFAAIAVLPFNLSRLI